MVSDEGVYYWSVDWYGVSRGIRSLLSFWYRVTQTPPFFAISRPTEPLSHEGKYPDVPDLQRARAQDPRALIFSHIRRRTPLPIRDLLLPEPHDRILLPRRGRCFLPLVVADAHDGVAVAVHGAVGRHERIRVVVARGFMRRARGAVGVFDVVGIDGFEGGFFVVGGFGGLVGLVAVGGFRWVGEGVGWGWEWEWGLERITRRHRRRRRSLTCLWEGSRVFGGWRFFWRVEID